MDPTKKASVALPAPSRCSLPEPQHVEWIHAGHTAIDGSGKFWVRRRDELDYESSERGTREYYKAPFYIARKLPSPEPTERSLADIEADLIPALDAFLHPRASEWVQRDRDNAIVIPDDDEEEEEEGGGEGEEGVIPQLPTPPYQQNFFSASRPGSNPPPCARVPATPPQKREADTSVMMGAPQKRMRTVVTPRTPTPIPRARNMVQPSQNFAQYSPQLSIPPMSPQQPQHPLPYLGYNHGNQPRAIPSNARPAMGSSMHAQHRDQQYIVASPFPPQQQQQQRPLPHLSYIHTHGVRAVSPNPLLAQEVHMQANYRQQQSTAAYPPPQQQQQQQQPLLHPGYNHANRANPVHSNFLSAQENQMQAFHMHQQSIAACRSRHASQTLRFHEEEQQRFLSWQQAQQRVQQNPTLLLHSRLPTWDEMQIQHHNRQAQMTARHHADLRALGVAV